MKEFEYKTLVSSPEFEVRCDRFVQAVENEVSGRYHHINVVPLNLTRAFMVDREQKILRLLAKDPNCESHQEKIRKLEAEIQRNEVASASYFTAMVGFYDKSHDRLIVEERHRQIVREEISQAFDEVQILSSDFQGERVLPSFTENIYQQIKASRSAEVYALYKFKDRQAV